MRQLFPWVSSPVAAAAPAVRPAVAVPAIELDDSADESVGQTRRRGRPRRQSVGNDPQQPQPVEPVSLEPNEDQPPDFEDEESSSDDGCGSDSDDAMKSTTPRREEDCIFDVQKTMHITGPLHVVANATKDFDLVMLHWGKFVKQLTHVCRLLRRSFTRDRFFNTCLNSAEVECFKHTVEIGLLNVYPGRWGTVVASINELIKLEDLLRKRWDLVKFSYGDNNARDGNAGGDEDVADTSI